VLNWVYGYHPVKEIINSKKYKIKKLFIKDSLLGKLNSEIKYKIDFPIIIAQKEKFNNIFADQVNHQSIALQIEGQLFHNESELLNKINNLNKIVILDQVTDVGNVGAIIRSMVAFNINDLIITEHDSVTDYAVLAKASAGLVAKINLYKITNLNSLITKLQKCDFWCVGLDGYAQAQITELKKFTKLAIFLGNEHKGIRELVKKNLDLLVNIPIAENAESLNVASAAAISFFVANNQD
jgi:23S rRNA (guanosine2251-2'-O)-methyltransferase